RDRIPAFRCFDTKKIDLKVVSHTSLFFFPTKYRWFCTYQRSTAHVSPVGVHTNDTAGRPPASSAMPRNVFRSMPECAPPFGWLCQVPMKARYPKEAAFAARKF